jgi:dsRNA-specific ribonuclease
MCDAHMRPLHLRTGLVNNKALAAFASRLGLHALVLHGEVSPSGKAWGVAQEETDKLMADTMEATSPHPSHCSANDECS